MAVPWFLVHRCLEMVHGNAWNERAVQYWIEVMDARGDSMKETMDGECQCLAGMAVPWFLVHRGIEMVHGSARNARAMANTGLKSWMPGKTAW
eukprot:10041113-Lingulodinium_polyedra.AAC.1